MEKIFEILIIIDLVELFLRINIAFTYVVWGIIFAELEKEELGLNYPELLRN